MARNGKQAVTGRRSGLGVPAPDPMEAAEVQSQTPEHLVLVEQLCLLGELVAQVAKLRCGLIGDLA
jgi:hypothetical protein